MYVLLVLGYFRFMLFGLDLGLGMFLWGCVGFSYVLVGLV